MKYQAVMPEWDYAASAAVYDADSVFTVWVRRACKAKGHPLTIDHSWANGDSAREDVQCLCGAEGFYHVYY